MFVVLDADVDIIKSSQIMCSIDGKSIDWQEIVDLIEFLSIS